MDLQPILISKKSAAQLLGISPRSVDYLIQRGQLKPRRIGRRVLLSYRSLQQFAQTRCGTAADPVRGDSQ